MKKLLWLAALIPIPLLVMAAFPTNGPPQSGFDSSGNGHPFYVDSNGNLSVNVNGNPTPPLPDAGNALIPADLANTSVVTTLTLCGATATALPTTGLIGRKWLVALNNGPNPVYISSSNTDTVPDGGATQGMMIVTSQAVTLPIGGNIHIYCTAQPAQVTPTALVPNGVTTMEGK